ncbi:MAG TPA: DUF4440 domain-containing protein [Chthoniobacterales bacterium]|jgi:hypothetical protein
MRKYLTYAVAILFATIAASFAGPDKAAIMAKETAAWQSFKDKKPDDFKKVVDKDIRCVYADGILKMQDELDGMQKSEVKSFAMSDFDSFSDEKDVIVVTYTIQLEATQDGKDISGTYNAGTVWKQEGANWLAIFHSHSKQEPKG